MNQHRIWTEDGDALCYIDSKVAAAEKGKTALDYPDIEWDIFREDLLAVMHVAPKQEMIVHCRLQHPEQAPYYQLAGWVHRTVMRIREINPVYAENIRLWLCYEIERPYLTAYRGSEESFGIDRVWNMLQSDASNPEPARQFIRDIYPSAERENAAEWVVRFIENYPELPESAVFESDPRLVQKYLIDGKPLDGEEILCDSGQKSDDSDALFRLSVECDYLANSPDTNYIRITEEASERFMAWLEHLQAFRKTIQEAISYGVDADGVSSLREAEERIAEIKQWKNYREFQRAAMFQDTERGMNGEGLWYEHNPLLLVAASLEWLFQKGRRKVRMCRCCERYFFLSSPKKIYCDRTRADLGITCQEYGNTIDRLQPDKAEIIKIHNTKRDEYSRWLRTISNYAAVQKEAERFEIWKKAAIHKRDAALRGDITIEELREILEFNKRDSLTLWWKEVEYEQAKRWFEQL